MLAGAAPAAGVRPLRVALAGFGVVGRSVARLLCERHDLRSEVCLTHVFNRRVAQKQADWVPAEVRWTDRIDDVLKPEVDVLVELVGGVDDAHAFVAEALRRGISVVTANKLLIARHGRSLLQLAAAHGAGLRFEASVAGGVPVIDAIEHGLAGDRLSRIAGVLNGTSNFVLSRMARRRESLEDALARARQLGLAEADPSMDLDGVDAAAKLVVLAGVAFRIEIDLADVRREPLGDLTATDFDYASRLGCTIRQVAALERCGDLDVDASVGPALVPRESPLARVEGAENLVLVRGAFGGDVTLSGRGAGGDATAVAVVSDLLALARGERRSAASGWQRGRRAASRPAAHYVRFVVRDRPGILAACASAFARHGINVDAVLQEPGHSKSQLPFVVTLEPCRREAVAAALEDLLPLEVHLAAPRALPILPGAQGGDD